MEGLLGEVIMKSQGPKAEICPKTAKTEILERLCDVWLVNLSWCDIEISLNRTFVMGEEEKLVEVDYALMHFSKIQTTSSDFLTICFYNHLQISMIYSIWWFLVYIKHKSVSKQSYQ